MASPRLSQLLFAVPGAGVLCGVTYGQPLESLTLPEWMASRHGHVDVNEGPIRSLSCTISGKHERVEKVWVTMQLTDYRPPKELFKELSAVVSERLGDRGSRQETLWRIWWFEGPPRGSVALQHDQSRLHLVVAPRAGESLDPLP